MASTNATAAASSLADLYTFLYPGTNCEILCIFAISTALLIVAVGLIVFVCVFTYICFSMPSRKAERQMKEIRDQMRKDSEAKKERRAAIAKEVNVRSERKEETSGNGTDRSSSFFHVNFKERVRFEDQQKAADVEMQPLSPDGSDMGPSLCIVMDRCSTNPLQRTVIVAPPHIIIEHSTSAEDEEENVDVIDETAPLRRSPTYDEPPDEEALQSLDDETAVAMRRSTSYDDVYETPRTSCASLILGRPLLADGYLSDEEYLDARSTIYQSREALEEDDDSDSNRTMTLTR